MVMRLHEICSGAITSIRVSSPDQASADAAALLVDMSGAASRIGPVVQTLTGEWAFSLECATRHAAALAMTLDA